MNQQHSKFRVVGANSQSPQDSSVRLSVSDPLVCQGGPLECPRVPAQPCLQHADIVPDGVRERVQPSNERALSVTGILLCTRRGQRVSGSTVRTRPLCSRLLAVRPPRPRAQAAPPFLSLGARGRRPCEKTGSGRSPDRAARRKPFLRPVVECPRSASASIPRELARGARVWPTSTDATAFLMRGVVHAGVPGPLLRARRRGLMARSPCPSSPRRA